MESFKRILSKSEKEKIFVGIRTYGSDDELWCGFILKNNEQFVQIQHFSEYGQPDGVVLESFNNIEGIDHEDHYSRAIEYLFKTNYRGYELNNAIKLSISKNWKYNVLKLNKAKDMVLAVRHEDENTYYGKVCHIDKKSFTIRTIDPVGQMDGKYTMRLAQILSIHINSIEGRKRNLLSKRK